VALQCAPNDAQYQKFVTYLDGMTGSWPFFEGVGRIIHPESESKPTTFGRELMERVFDIGRKMLR
jgi:hypothetical protein